MLSVKFTPHNVATCCKERHHQGACAQICLSWGTMENKQWFKGHLYYMKEMHLLTKEHLPNGRHRDSEEQLKLPLGSEAPQTAIFAFLNLDGTGANTVQALNWPANAAAAPPQPLGPYQLQASYQVSSPIVHTRTSQCPFKFQWCFQGSPITVHLETLQPKTIPAHLSVTHPTEATLGTHLKKARPLRPAACMCLVIQSCLTLCDPMDRSSPGSSVHGDFPSKNTGVGCHVLLQGIFPTQGSNPGLLSCRRILYHLNHQGSPRTLEWVAYPFSMELPTPEIKQGPPALQVDSLPAEPAGKP